MKSKYARYYITSSRSITIYSGYESGNKRRTPAGNPTGVKNRRYNTGLTPDCYP